MYLMSTETRNVARRFKLGIVTLKLFDEPHSPLGQDPVEMRRNAPVPPTPTPGAGSEAEATPNAVQPSIPVSKVPF